MLDKSAVITYLMIATIVVIGIILELLINSEGRK